MWSVDCGEQSELVSLSYINRERRALFSLLPVVFIKLSMLN